MRVNVHVNVCVHLIACGVCDSSVSCSFLAQLGSLYGPSLEIIRFFCRVGLTKLCCAVNQPGHWDYCWMCSHECMGFHLIKVFTDNCYYLISTIWEETVFIRGFDWDVERRETNVCFVVLYKSLLSGGLCICRDGGFCVRNFDEVLVSRPIPCLCLGKYPCVPHPPSSSAIPGRKKTQCTALKMWADGWKSFTLSGNLHLNHCLYGKLLEMRRLVFERVWKKILQRDKHRNMTETDCKFVFYVLLLHFSLRTKHQFVWWWIFLACSHSLWSWILILPSNYSAYLFSTTCSHLQQTQYFYSEPWI